MGNLIFEYNGRAYVAWSSDDLRAAGIPETIIQNAETENKWLNVRRKRDFLITQTDKEYLRHERELRSGKSIDSISSPTTLSCSQLAVLDAYVQCLADIPQTTGSPDDVIWPNKPSL